MTEQLKVGDRVELVANEDEGWSRKYGTVLEVESEDCVLVEIDGCYRDEHDDGLREVEPQFLRRVTTKDEYDVPCSVELDTVDPHNVPLGDWCMKHHVRMQILQNEGPSGWPLVKYRGGRRALDEMITVFWNDTDLCEYIEIL